MSLARKNSPQMICPLHLRAIQWKKGDLIVFFRAMETSQLDVANCGPIKGNAGIGVLVFSGFIAYSAAASSHVAFQSPALSGGWTRCPRLPFQPKLVLIL